ncbi:hypothetical protein HC891_24645 [Candidatus Gracilibacteria bacterium]|nr:hypothetical protein [Candidatus Gracilibacteria bacterium]
MESNEELRALFADDQGDHHGETHPQIVARDAARRQRVSELMDVGALRTGEDFLHAAFIFQHGSALEDYWQAHELALQAVDLGHPHPARWLAAAAYDRWLMHQGLPQKFGTQYLMRAGRWSLYEVDPLTSDEERGRWNVPSLAVAVQRADEMNRSEQGSRHVHPAQRRLASATVAELTVEVLEIEPGEAFSMPEAMPQPEPWPGDGSAPLPGYLPAGLRAALLGDGGYCAVDAAGQIVVTWFALGLPLDEPMYLAWNRVDGDPPQLKIIDLGPREAIWVSATWSAVNAERPPVLIVRAGPETCWLIGGQLPSNELAQIASSLPLLPGVRAVKAV